MFIALVYDCLSIFSVNTYLPKKLKFCKKKNDIYIFSYNENFVRVR